MTLRAESRSARRPAILGLALAAALAFGPHSRAAIGPEARPSPALTATACRPPGSVDVAEPTETAASQTDYLNQQFKCAYMRAQNWDLSGSREYFSNYSLQNNDSTAKLEALIGLALLSSNDGDFSDAKNFFDSAYYQLNLFSGEQADSTVRSGPTSEDAKALMPLYWLSKAASERNQGMAPAGSCPKIAFLDLADFDPTDEQRDAGRFPREVADCHFYNAVVDARKAIKAEREPHNPFHRSVVTACWESVVKAPAEGGGDQLVIKTGGLEAEAPYCAVKDFLGGNEKKALPSDEKNLIFYAQALEIAATSLEALDPPHPAVPMALLDQAQRMLAVPSPNTGPGGTPQPVGFAAPWLRTQLAADQLHAAVLLRDRVRLIREIRLAIDPMRTFQSAHPGSLPLARYVLELAHAEAVLADLYGTSVPALAQTLCDRPADAARGSKASGDRIEPLYPCVKKQPSEQDIALFDYEHAFDIMIKQRGAIGNSVDLAQEYFDIRYERLCRRSECPAGAPANATDEDADHFFRYSQALTPQFTANAARISFAADPATRPIWREFQEATEQVNELTQEQARLDVAIATASSRGEDGQVGGDGNGQNVPALLASIAKLRADRLKTHEDLIRWQGRANSLGVHFDEINPSPTSIEEILSAPLRDGEVYLKMFMLPDHGYGVVIRPRTGGAVAAELPVTIYKIGLTSKAVAEDIGRMRWSVDNDPLHDQPPRCPRGGSAPVWDSPPAATDTTGPSLGPCPFDVKSARGLYDALRLDLALAASSTRPTKNLIVEPDATLSRLPVPALLASNKGLTPVKCSTPATASGDEGCFDLVGVTDHEGWPDYKGLDWLFERAATSISLSPSAFVADRRKKPTKKDQPFLGFAGPTPVGNLPIKDAEGKFVVDAQGNPVLAYDAAYRNIASLVDKRVDLISGSQLDQDCEGWRMALANAHVLLASVKEVDKVAKALGAPLSYWPGDAFTDLKVLCLGGGESCKDGGDAPRLKDYSVLYFATHGFLPPPNNCKMLPLLLTSWDRNDSRSDGLLTIEKISRLNIDADLVVLSACDTGISQRPGDVGGFGGVGDEIGILAASFVKAGARNIVATNWEENSETGADIMTLFFDPKVNLVAGPRQDDALRHAVSVYLDKIQAKVDRDYDRQPAEPRNYLKDPTHPFYWAFFMLIGDGGLPMPAAKPTDPQQAASLDRQGGATSWTGR